MIKQVIECEWPGCKLSHTEAKEGLGFPGWGHIRGFKLDGIQRDLHLCPQHLAAVGALIKEKANGVD
jgi:hypothetical protein